MTINREDQGSALFPLRGTIVDDGGAVHVDDNAFGVSFSASASNRWVMRCARPCFQDAGSFVLPLATA